MDKKDIIIIILIIGLLVSFLYDYSSQKLIKTDSFNFSQEWSLGWGEGETIEEKRFIRIEPHTCNEEKRDTNLDCFVEEFYILPKQINLKATYPILLVETKCVCWEK